jgi:hypothetical protein
MQSNNHKNSKTETSLSICVEEKHIKKRLWHTRFLQGLPLGVSGIIDLMERIQAFGFHLLLFL